MSTIYTSGKKCQHYTQVSKRLKMSTLYTCGKKCQHYTQEFKNFKIIH